MVLGLVVQRRDAEKNALDGGALRGRALTQLTLTQFRFLFWRMPVSLGLSLPGCRDAHKSINTEVASRSRLASVPFPWRRRHHRTVSAPPARFLLFPPRSQFWLWRSAVLISVLAGWPCDLPGPRDKREDVVLDLAFVARANSGAAGQTSGLGRRSRHIFAGRQGLKTLCDRSGGGPEFHLDAQGTAVSRPTAQHAIASDQNVNAVL